MSFLTTRVYLTAISAAGFAAFALLPPKLAWRLIKSSGFAWAYRIVPNPADPSGLTNQLPFNEAYHLLVGVDENSAYDLKVPGV
jgi:hypothetical protein